MITNPSLFEEAHMQHQIWNFGGQLDLKHLLGDNTGLGSIFNLKMGGGNDLGGSRRHPDNITPSRRK